MTSGSGRWSVDRWKVPRNRNLRGKTYVVTGANSGMGLETARFLAAADGRVILACRNLDKAEIACSDIRSSTSNGDLHVRHLDLADLSSVRRFASEVERDGEAVHGLINNAGVFAIDQGLTVDGFESHFGVNHLGHFALTGLLLPALFECANSRIVNVSSLGHRAGRLDVSDPMFDRRAYSRWGAYFQSKLANLLFTYELDRRLRTACRTTTAVSAHPGTASTEIGKTGSSWINLAARRFMPILVRDGTHGSRSQIRAIVDPDVVGGELFGPRLMFLGSPVLETPSRRARNPRDAFDLWELSESLTGISFPV